MRNGGMRLQEHIQNLRTKRMISIKYLIAEDQDFSPDQGISARISPRPQANKLSPWA